MSDPPRILFTGTLDDAQDFYQQTEIVGTNTPIAKYTDGMPIVIPTQEAVTEMLTGTSHLPGEQIYAYTRSESGQYSKSDNPVTFGGNYTATVEQVAVIAVMAGCKPEYLPAVLAGATAGGGFTDPTTVGNIGYYYVVSGPFAKQIGMNAGHGALNVGSIGNMTIGRTMNLVTIDIARYIQGVSRNDAGHPFYGLSFAEDDTLLPTGWESLREESGYGKEESALGKGAGYIHCRHVCPILFPRPHR